jgi:hypothetical protein
LGTKKIRIEGWKGGATREQIHEGEGRGLKGLAMVDVNGGT